MALHGLTAAPYWLALAGVALDRGLPGAPAAAAPSRPGASIFPAVLWIAVIFVAMGAGDAAIIPLLLVLPVMAVNLAVCVRRLHDRDRSAWWLLCSGSRP